MTTNFTFYSRAEYFKALSKAANSASKGDRIAITTMTYDAAEPLISELMEALTGAAKRGANVILLVDAYCLLVNEETKWPGPLWYRPNLRARMWEPFKSRLAALETLRKHGGDYTVLNVPNKPFSAIPAGRSHIKFAVINKRLFVGGGNLRDVDKLDVMTSWHDTKTADLLYGLARDMHAAASTKNAFQGKDQSFVLGPETTLLLDAGKPKQSLIYDHALELIDNAEEWLYIASRFFPGGRTGQHLRAAHRRGVKVQVTYGPPRAHGRDAYMMYAYNSLERSRLPADFFKASATKHPKKVHAKVLATEKGAMTGSHNYITQGVTFGTAELALKVMNPKFSAELTDFTKSLLE